MSCEPFPKIDTLFDRGDDFRVDEAKIRRPEFAIPKSWLVTEKVDGTNVRVSLEEELRSGLDPDSPGSLTDEIHWVIRFYGRTENSQMPTFLLEHLQSTFTLEKMQRLWRCRPSCEKCNGTHGNVIMGIDKESNLPKVGPIECPNFAPYSIVLYGEGYGARIQKGGGDYRRGGDVSLRLFDVLIGGTWLRRADVEDVARQLGIEAVPRLEVDDRGTLTIDEIVQLVEVGFASSVANMEGVEGTPAEGVVAFTDPPLFNSRGQRLIWKLKTRDFVAGKR